MGEPGIDIAWARPTTAQILATGARWVARYFSGDATKNLRADEVTAYTVARLGIVTVWETTTGRALEGFAAGQADARAAEQQRAAVGLPADHIHHFAVDTDTDWASVASYFDGVSSVIGKTRAGVYGGLRVIDGAAAAGYRYLWQTIAWSGGVWSAHATIRQTGGTTLQGDADVDQAVAADFGQYPRPVEDDMPYTPAQLVEYARQGALAAIESQPGRDSLAFADLWWLDHALAGTSTPGMTPAQAGLIADIHRLVTQLGATTPPPKPTPPAAATPA